MTKKLNIVLFVLGLWSSPWLTQGPCPAVIIPQGENAGPLRFDAIVQMNAPIVGTHVLLFVRYWVSTDYYCVSVVWAEPHIGQLNFCTYPITLNILSDEAEFLLSSQIVDGVTSRFAKPVGDRGVFRCMFNDYPVSNLRYADSEALATRVFVRDLETLNTSGLDVPLPLSCRAVAGTLDYSRSITSVKLDTTDGRVTRIGLLDANDLIAKAVEYEYSSTSDEPGLRREIVVLPECSVEVGFPVGSVKARSNGDEVHLGVFARTYHGGSRMCSVEHRPVSVGEASVVLPHRVSVRHGESGKLLRAAQLSGFERGEVDKNSAQQAARLFSHFSPEMLKCRQLLLAYWLKDPLEVAPVDRDALRKLQEHFDGLDRRFASPGEELRRLNMLFQLAWMLGDSEHLAAHYGLYLALLHRYDLEEMLLLGGCHVIETTVLWGQLRVADQLLETWVQTTNSAVDPCAILQFARVQAQKGWLWGLAKSVGRLLTSAKLTPTQKLEAQTMRCLAYTHLYLHMAYPETLRGELDVMQIGWVSRSLSASELRAVAEDSFVEASDSLRALQESHGIPHDIADKLWSCRSLLDRPPPRGTGDPGSTSR